MRTINKEDMINALKDGTVKINNADNFGIRIRIGLYGTYLHCFESNELSLEDFLTEEIAEIILKAIGTEELAEGNGIGRDEWNYYYDLLHKTTVIYLTDAELITIKMALKDSMDKLREGNFESELEIAQELYNRII